MSAFRRWLVRAYLCLSGGIIYLLPYLWEIYYLPLLEALNLINIQPGTGILFVMPSVWFLSVVIMAAYSAYWGSYYFTPYASDVFKMSVVFGGALFSHHRWFVYFRIDLCCGCDAEVFRVQPANC